MKLEKLVSSIQAESESGNFTLQSIFDRHIDTIESCKREGVTYKRLREILALGITNSHFNNLIHRARKRKNDQLIVDLNGLQGSNITTT